MNGKQYTFNRAFLCTVTNHPYFGGAYQYADGQSSQSRRGLSCRERINIFKILWLIFLLLRQNKGNLSIFIIFNQAKFELFRRFHKPFADGEILGKRSIDMVYTTQKRLFCLK